MPDRLFSPSSWITCPLTSSRSVSSVIAEMRTSGLFLPRPVFGDGLCSADLPRESPRHRNLPGFYARQVVPHGISRTSDALYTGRCQRGARLAHLCRLFPGADCHCPAAVCKRSLRRGPCSGPIDRKSTRLNSSHLGISYA